VTGLLGSGAAAPAAVGHVTTPTQRRRRRRRVIGLVAALAGFVVISLVIAANHYQPLDNSGGLIVENYQFPGLPAGVRPVPVNTFGNLPGELYLRPQRGVMTLAVILKNDGPMAVTIESVSIDPQLPNAGKPLYLVVTRATANSGFSAVRGPVHGISIGPGETIVMGIPIHVPECVNKSATPYVMTDFYTITERFLAFTHAAQISIGPTPLIWLPGYARGTADFACAK
jgi:hypothetical protein